MVLLALKLQLELRWQREELQEHLELELQLVFVWAQGLQRALQRRGKGKEPKPVDILPVLYKARGRWVNLGLDTLAVQQYKDILDAEKISEALRTTAEGRFIMYIDAVDMCISPSSYSDVKVPFTANNYNREPNYISNVIEENYPQW